MTDAIRVMQEGDGIPVLIFMSDGCAGDTQGSFPLADQMRTAFQARGLQTHFVGFGNNVNVQELRGLAERSGGEYHAAKDGDALSDIFSDIAVTTAKRGSGQTNTASGGAFFASLTNMRKGGEISQETVDQAVDRLQTGKQVGSLEEFHAFLQKKFPARPTFNVKLAQGRHPEGLAAFVVAVQWPNWQKHGLWSLHGDLYVDRLDFAKASLPAEKYRDNLAGALMHRANGNAHLAKHAKLAGLSEVQLPCWSAPRGLVDVASSAVADLRQACTLRSMKYGAPGSSKSIFFAYQASLRNLADAMEIHADVAGREASGVDFVRKKAEDLVLKDPKLIEAVEAGEKLSVTIQENVDRDVRIAESVASSFVLQAGGQETQICRMCSVNPSTSLGFVCRCKCLCDACVTTGDRIKECPMCGDWTEFVKAA